MLVAAGWAGTPDVLLLSDTSGPSCGIWGAPRPDEGVWGLPWGLPPVRHVAATNSCWRIRSMISGAEMGSDSVSGCSWNFELRAPVCVIITCCCRCSGDRRGTRVVLAILWLSPVLGARYHQVEGVLLLGKNPVLPHLPAASPPPLYSNSANQKKITPYITRQTSTLAANRIGRLGKGRRELRQTEWQRLSPGEEHQGISVEKPRNAVKMPNKTKKEKVISASLACPGHFSTEIRCGGCFFFCCWRLQPFYFTELMASSPASC